LIFCLPYIIIIINKLKWMWFMLSSRWGYLGWWCYMMRESDHFAIAAPWTSIYIIVCLG
jgi:hypothetical protein